MPIIFIPDNMIERIDVRRSSISMKVSRNSFLVCLIRHELDKMDELDDEDESVETYLEEFIVDIPKTGRARGSARKVRRIEDGVLFDSSTSAAKSTKVTHMAIYNALNGRTKTSGGYHWEYVK